MSLFRERRFAAVNALTVLLYAALGGGSTRAGVRGNGRGRTECRLDPAWLPADHACGERAGAPQRGDLCGGNQVALAFMAIFHGISG